MADEKTANFEETKWWIDRGPVKERDKSAEPIKGIIEKWAYELLKNYGQDQKQSAASARHTGYRDRCGLFRARDHHRRAGRRTLHRCQFYRCAILGLLGERSIGRGKSVFECR